MNKWLNRSCALLGLAGFLASPASASYPEYQDMQRRDADPSPGPGRSHINDYRFQDEQINIAPDDGLVKVLRTNQKNLVND
jgi:hypothetical protein